METNIYNQKRNYEWIEIIQEVSEIPAKKIVEEKNEKKEKQPVIVEEKNEKTTFVRADKEPKEKKTVKKKSKKNKDEAKKK